jgi:polysaccharide pyruvyl transferase WcaK-like protein
MIEPNSFLRNFVLRFFPFFRNIKRKVMWQRTVRAWQNMVRDMPAVPLSAKTQKLVIIPPDPYTLIGSRGDEAMFDALIKVARNLNQDIEFFVVTGSDEADSAAKKKGLIPLQIWKHAFSPKIILAKLKEISPDALAVIGADVIDGYYNPYLPFHAFMFADLATRIGARAAIMGFSFNRKPWPELKEVFELTSKNVVINLRDSVSLARFNEFCECPTNLVADSAFYLEPDLECLAKIEAEKWVDSTHKAGRKAVAFNIHPMLFKNATQKQIAGLVTDAANAIEAVTKLRDVNWLFLSHDYRDKVGDNICLIPLAAELTKRGLSDRFIHFYKDYTAQEIKAIASQVDGVVTARMHLAIGSLGMGVPVAVLTYQDKFLGLFKHFNLPEWLLLNPSNSGNFNIELKTLMLRFIDEMDSIREKVQMQLPDVKKRAMKNFIPLFVENPNSDK